MKTGTKQLQRIIQLRTLDLLCRIDFCHRLKALKGRQMIAQGKAAQQPQPWVKRPILQFFGHSPQLKANDEKTIGAALFYEAHRASAFGLSASGPPTEWE